MGRLFEWVIQPKFPVATSFLVNEDFTQAGTPIFVPSEDGVQVDVLSSPILSAVPTAVANTGFIPVYQGVLRSVFFPWTVDIWIELRLISGGWSKVAQEIRGHTFNVIPQTFGNSTTPFTSLAALPGSTLMRWQILSRPGTFAVVSGAFSLQSGRRRL